MCNEDAHLPIPCELLQTWNERINDEDGDTKMWLKLNTKNCPKCKKPIQKNSGCMHMTCSSCKHQFCWICLADDPGYSHTGGGGQAASCNRFDGADAARIKEMNEADKTEYDMKRLDHFKTRF